MINVRRYSQSDKEIWNNYNKESKNFLFMFDRDYMEYHKDRFVDHSLMFYNDDRLIALLPVSEKYRILYSHGGLTFGGFISGIDMKQHLMNDCFDSLIGYAKTQGIEKIIYKAIPHIYHTQPAEEDRYSLFLSKAELVKVEASTVINLSNPIKMPKGRKAQISRARREGVEIQELKEESDYQKFIDLENEVLGKYHGASAVHTGKELFMLHDTFPENIRLFGAMKDGSFISGAVIFEYDNIVHTQYMAANDEARTVGALDLTISTIIEKYKQDKIWFDFGKSTEGDGRYLNEGLISQKEGFGGRTNIYETWVINI